MKLYTLDITAVKEESGVSMRFDYITRADSEEAAKRKCEEDLFGCKVTYHSVEVEK